MIDGNAKLLWQDRIQELLVPAVRHWIEREGIDESGARNFYKARVDRGELFSDYDLAIARELIRRGLAIDSVHEIGSGLGQLMFLLGWNGFKTLGFDLDAPRARHAQDLREILRVVDAKLTANIELIEGVFPAGNLPAPGPRSLVLATNLVTTLTSDQQIAIVRGMRQYAFVLIDIQRLFEKRTDESSQKKALALFSDAGFTSPEVFLDLGSSGLYFLFTNT